MVFLGVTRMPGDMFTAAATTLTVRKKQRNIRLRRITNYCKRTDKISSHKSMTSRRTLAYKGAYESQKYSLRKQQL